MNLYRVNFKRTYKRGLQLEEDSYLTVANDAKHAEQIVSSRLKKESVIITSTSRIQDGAYLVAETYLVDNVS